MTRLAGAYGIAVASTALKSDRLMQAAPYSDRWTFTAAPSSTTPRPEAETAAVPGPEDALDLARFHPMELTDERAEIAFEDGLLTLSRVDRTAHLAHAPDLDPELVIHPFLAGVGIVAAHWGRRAPFHAGAVIVDGQAWAVLAERANGKSTTMAALDAAGFAVLTDDLLVVDGDLRAHVGPRCLDLRPESATAFPEAVVIGDRGDRARHRLPLGPAPASAPLAGFIRLGWSPPNDDHPAEDHHDQSHPVANSGVTLSPVAPGDRLAVIAASLSLHAPVANPLLMLDLAALPSYVLTRPKRLSTLPAVAETFAALGGTHS